MSSTLNHIHTDTKARLEPIVEKYSHELVELEQSLQQNETLKDPQLYKSTSKSYSEMKIKFDAAKQVLATIDKLDQAGGMLQTEVDPEIIEMCKLEVAELNSAFAEQLKQYELVSTVQDPLDSGNAILEIRAGAGGEESAIFAQELYRAYSKFAEGQGLKVELANLSYSGAGAVKEVIFFVNGEGAYKLFKFENGVHRVQRVPTTESSGRIHTSVVSVVVLPESDEINVEIKEEDIRIDVYRSSGPGGQSVNTTDSAVRIVHNPTGIVVTCQDEKSQLKNKAKAMKILQAKLYDIERERQEQETSQLRQSAIKTGDRSAKIRTYNFPQSRVTDHRIKQSWHNLSEIMEGQFLDIQLALENFNKEHGQVAQVSD